nr:iron-containing alcohol dehydrogenase [uncultured Cohaesibacter sp.]
MIIFGAPRRYLQGPDLIERIGEELSAIGRKVALISSKRIQATLGDDIASSCAAAGVSLKMVPFEGEASTRNIDHVVGQLVGLDVDVVVSVGGGKVIDVGKIVSNRVGADYVAVPTIASNDAPTSHVAVIHDDDGRVIGLEKSKANPALVLVDTALIAKAPLCFLSAGIGDALVKRFEVEQCARTGGHNVFGSQSTGSALALAYAAYDSVRAHTSDAFLAVKSGTPNEAFEKLVEACILMSGLAFENGGLSVSHGMTRGLSAVPGVAQALHGHQVAYGLLVQLVLEGRDKPFMDDIRSFYQQAHLPLKLGEMDGDGKDPAVIKLIAETSASAAHMKKFEKSITATDIEEAIVAIENA